MGVKRTGDAFWAAESTSWRQRDLATSFANFYSLGNMPDTGAKRDQSGWRRSSERDAVTPDSLPSTPAMPTVSPADVYGGPPNLLLLSGVQHSVGWQKHRKSGPSFVVARLGPSGKIMVTERFALTEEGWARAWQALTALDAPAAAAVAAKLAKLAEHKRAASDLA